MEKKLHSECPLIIAHRGGRFWLSNDFSYITESVEGGADIIELDVRLDRNQNFTVQHDIFSKPQGMLEHALQKIDGKSVYLDIKDTKIDINRLINFSKDFEIGSIIIGTHRLETFSKISDSGVLKNYHMLFPTQRTFSRLAHNYDIDWINPICYFVTKKLAYDIQNAGFKFVPSGNQIRKKGEIYKNQIKFASYGAYAISTHHVREMKIRLESSI